MTDTHQRGTLESYDGHTVHTQTWVPADSPQAIIQILHGLGEHSDRYGRFAAAANHRGFVVGIHDHRGHGAHAQELGFFAEENGWDLLINDALLVQNRLMQQYPGLPVILLGHSMGSFIAQDFAIRNGHQLQGLILSASTGLSRIETWGGRLLARFECWRVGPHGKSALLHKLGFSDFNKPFNPARTELDWLTRDDAEVDIYIADPLCGGPYTSSLWRDLMSGFNRIAADENIARIPTDLPVLITGGEKDPIGGARGMDKLATRFAKTGHDRLAVKIYPDGRHEMLNETNRDQVTTDWLNWIATSTHTNCV